MYYKLFILFVFVLKVRGSGIFHENTKLTFKPDSSADYFGFTVVMNDNNLIVGAPKAVIKEKSVAAGVVFNCSLRRLDVKNIVCSPLDIGGRGHYERYKRVPEGFFKNDMWFGATIGSLTPGKLLVCAPRYTEIYNKNHYLANGACYLRSKNREYIVYPLVDKYRQAHMTDGARREYGEYGTHLNFYAYGQVGMSIKVVENNTVILGAPGLLQWTGGVINYRYSPDEDSIYFSMQVTTNPYKTKEIGPDDYFGYSVEAGIFEKNGKTLYVAGAPRSKMGFGQVLIFEPATREQDPLKIKAKLRGRQLGAYFGATLCCLDINGDGLDDILVGAPNYVKKDIGLPYDQGAVFVHMTIPDNPTFILKETTVVFGSSESGARFGTAIASLGDVDGDGYPDVAIGAPWEKDGKGVVYIYRGTSSGLKSSYTQRIAAEGATSFGIAIAKGFDVDHNNCNDLAVGAAKSSSVYLYRCIPSIPVYASIKVPDAMNLPHNATGFTALFCITVPDKPLWSHVRIVDQKLDTFTVATVASIRSFLVQVVGHKGQEIFNAKIVVDPEDHRAEISRDSEYKVTATPGNERCDEQTVEVKPTVDLSKPISIKFELTPDEMMKNDSTIFNPNAARVSELSLLETSFLIQLVRDCGEDMICTPWLEMTMEALDTFFIPETNTKLGARLRIFNKEEPAYGAKVNITLPMTPKRLPSDCSLEELVIKCDVPAPLFRNEEVVWDIELEYSLKESKEVNVTIVAELEDSLYYRNITKESYVELTVTVRPEASFNVSGKTLQNSTLDVTREKFYGAENISFVHFFEITNLGPSDWYNLEATILLPETVNLSSQIKGCDIQERIHCIWTVPAKVSKPVALPLRFDLRNYGNLLENNSILNVTSELIINWNDQKSTKVMTSLVLEPAPSLWPLILGIISGIFSGFILLAAIVYPLYKYGFFSRSKREKLKELQEQTESSNGTNLDLDQPPGSSSEEQLESLTNESTQQLLLEDSD